MNGRGSLGFGKGALVHDTSVGPYVVLLIQAHADVVSQFVASGFAETQKNHGVPWLIQH